MYISSSTFLLQTLVTIKKVMPNTMITERIMYKYIIMLLSFKSSAEPVDPSSTVAGYSPSTSARALLDMGRTEKKLVRS